MAAPGVAQVVTTIVLEQDVPVRMRDGVILYADVYRPAGPGRYPLLLCRTPYGRELSPLMILTMSPLQAVQAGYVVVIQDTRGRGASQGRFAYVAQLPQEGPDGYDTVEWAASLPYANGEVGMFGMSYSGWTQWAAAMQRPPHLRAIAPLETAARVTDGLVYRGGAYELGYTLFWHLMMSKEVTAGALEAAGASDERIVAAQYEIVAAFDHLSAGGYTDLPLRDLPSLRKLGLSGILRYLLDPGPAFPGISQPPVGLGAALTEPGLSEELVWPGPGNTLGWADVAYAQVAVPSLNIGGWHDCFLQRTLDDYTAMRAQGRPAQLLIGPWAHGVFGGWLTATVGEMEYGMSAHGASIELEEDLTATQLRWFDHWLMGADNGVEREPAARVFLTGENLWTTWEDWPPAGAHELPLYLHPDGALGFAPPGGVGGAHSAASTGSASRYTYDPAHPAPTLGGNTLMPGVYPPGVKDQRPLSRRPDVLTFTGVPLERPLVAVGRVGARLWASSSAPDTDFVARLLDVHPDGTMENVCDGIIRARYRDALTGPQWLEPGRANALRVDLWSVAHVFKAGHRPGVQVTSSSFPRWDRNWNTREDPGAAMAGQVAEQAIWHDAENPSCIVLAVLS